MIKELNIQFPIYCQLCNKEIKSLSGLGSHIKNQHNDKINYLEYLHIYYGYSPRIESDDIKLKCELCGKLYHNLTSHIKTHNISTFDYKKKYNLLQIQSKYLINKRTNACNISRPTFPRRTLKERYGDNYNNWKEKFKGMFTLQWFINKYGKDQGTKLYKERCNSISKNTYFRTYISSQSTSKIAQELFLNLYNKISNIYSYIYFNPLTHEHSCGTGKYNYDFVILDNKKVIEFNGDFWHANPLQYKANDIIPIPGGPVSAESIWNKDILKINALKNNGYDVLIIWQSEYENNKDLIIKTAQDFILRNKI